jgi:hypothetical protein
VARTDLELMDIILNKKPTKFNMSLTRICVREGFIEVLEWWKQTELIELFIEAAYSGQWRMLDSLYKNENQQEPSNLKELLEQMIVNWAASGGQIDALEWAWDQGIHGGTEYACGLHAEVTCMCCNGSERMELTTKTFLKVLHYIFWQE